MLIAYWYYHIMTIIFYGDISISVVIMVRIFLVNVISGSISGMLITYILPVFCMELVCVYAYIYVRKLCFRMYVCTRTLNLSRVF